jgi:hypothetical protein
MATRLQERVNKYRRTQIFLSCDWPLAGVNPKEEGPLARAFLTYLPRFVGGCG